MKIKTVHYHDEEFKFFLDGKIHREDKKMLRGWGMTVDEFDDAVSICAPRREELGTVPEQFSILWQTIGGYIHS